MFSPAPSVLSSSGHPALISAELSGDLAPTVTAGPSGTWPELTWASVSPWVCPVCPACELFGQDLSCAVCLGRAGF